LKTKALRWLRFLPAIYLGDNFKNLKSCNEIIVSTSIPAKATFMLLTLSAITSADEPFLQSVYAATRADEMRLVPWSAQQKEMFLQMQFQAQQEYYLSRYPNASLRVIKFNDESIGRLYIAELADEIRIIDITILPEYRNRGIGTRLVKDILQTSAEKQKPVQIYVENFNQSSQLFAGLGFEPVSEQGVHVLWRCEPT
jgi:ribosomal protein S18 acetylase RimI-like enzyme